MTIEQADLDAVAELDLQELVEAQVPEGLRLEYKQAVYGNSDADKRELLKDLSAFANTHGGHVILGLQANGGVASSLVGVETQDVDAEILRMEQIARAGLEPPISGMRMRSVPLQSGRQAIVVRVPRSWNPPHRMIAGGKNRFYARHSAGVYEPSVEELRTLFTQTGTALEQARGFRDQRLAYVRGGGGTRPLVGHGKLILHIIPVAAFSGMVNLDVASVLEHHRSFMPIGADDYSPRFNYYGFVNERTGAENHGYTQLFRNGVLEATKGAIVREFEGHDRIPGGALETQIFSRLSSYVFGLRNINVPPPLVILFTLQDVAGVDYVVRRDIYRENQSFLPEYEMTLPGCVLDDYQTELEHHKAVRPAFDALWNAIGYAGSQYFDQDGRWVGMPR